MSGALSYQVFTSPFHEIGDTGETFSPTTSTLVTGEQDAILIDAQHIRADVTALGDMIEASGKRLTTIYVTHGHADHWFGIGELVARFPTARPVARPGVVEVIESTLELSKGQWHMMFGDNVVEPTVLPQPLDGDALELEGHELRIVDLPQGDINPSTLVHVPELGLVVPGDVVYNTIHVMLGFTDREGWGRWLESLDVVEQLRPKAIIAGHKLPGASDEAVEEMIEGTRSYLRDYREAVDELTDPDALIELMKEKYPTYGNPWTLWFSAHSSLGQQPTDV
jgi:glyoxylase-like metal-dependent hydrolase (beta-lactamase superfamily II)